MLRGYRGDTFWNAEFPFIIFSSGGDCGPTIMTLPESSHPVETLYEETVRGRPRGGIDGVCGLNRF